MNVLSHFSLESEDWIDLNDFHHQGISHRGSYWEALGEFASEFISIVVQIQRFC